MPQRICSIEGCTAPAKARGWCGKHHQQHLRSGVPLPPIDRPSVPDRYWSHVDRSAGSDACWPWTGGRDYDGYGIFWDGTYTAPGRGRSVRSTRWGFEQLIGPIPEGHGVLHTCDSPPCQNPVHWFTGTNGQNNSDRASKRRSNPQRGVAHVSAKLTDLDVLRIRASRMSGADLAERYGVTPSTISKIVNRKVWTHI
jgi:hypothetical protein